MSNPFVSSSRPSSSMASSVTSPLSSAFSSLGSSSSGSVSRGPSGYAGPGSFVRSSPFSRFSSNKYVSGTRAFLESNSIVAKFAFLLLVLVVFIVLLRFGTYLIEWAFSPSNTPVLITAWLTRVSLLSYLRTPLSRVLNPS